MDKENLYHYFITENHSRIETAKYFNLTEASLRYNLKKFGINKPKTLSVKNNTNLNSNKGKIKCVDSDGNIKMVNPEDSSELKIAKDQIEISKEDLIYDFINGNMPRKEVAEKYGVSENRLRSILKYYGIKKSKSLAVKLRNKTVNNNNSLSESIKRVPKSELVEYYINQNHSRRECCKHFNVTLNNLKAIISEYDLPDKDRKLVGQTYLQVMKETYGVLTGFELSGKGHTSDSKPNIQFKESMEAAGVKDFEREFIISNFRYDFKVGDKLIEINPTVTHNSTWSPYGEPRPSNYHKDKTKLANENNYSCIHVWDWDNINSIINLLKPRETVYARECIIKDVSVKDAKDFINLNHIQGYARDSVRLGLYFNGQLVSIMTFGIPRYNHKYNYELIRYCSTHNVIGGSEKLFKHFISLNPNTSIISYCDESKFNGNTYLKLGFSKLNISSPTIHWYNVKTKKHITDNLLRQRGFDQLFGTNYGKGSSNEELMLNEGFVKVYDCGQSTYVFQKTSPNLSSRTRC